MGAAVFVYCLAFVLRAFRWEVLITPLKSCVPVSRLFSLLVLGFFMNNVLPFRLGEIIRANTAGQKLSITRTGVLATILVERLFDGISYITLFLITIMFLPFPAWAKRSFTAGAVVFAGALVMLYFLLKHRELASGLMLRLPLPEKFKNRLQGMFNNFIDGLQVFSKGSSLIKVFFLSVAVWSVEGSVFFLMGQSFGIGLSIFQCFFVMIIIGMGAIIPTAPGFVGTVEFLGVTSLAFLGVDKNQAFGFIITLHLLQLITVSLLGIRSLITEKISFGELIRIEKRP
jgi:uncharacterized protein (TIRG00374 family)